MCLILSMCSPSPTALIHMTDRLFQCRLVCSSESRPEVLEQFHKVVYVFKYFLTKYQALFLYANRYGTGEVIKSAGSAMLTEQGGNIYSARLALIQAYLTFSGMQQQSLP